LAAGPARQQDWGASGSGGLGAKVAGHGRVKAKQLKLEPAADHLLASMLIAMEAGSSKISYIILAAVHFGFPVLNGGAGVPFFCKGTTAIDAFTTLCPSQPGKQSPLVLPVQSHAIL